MTTPSEAEQHLRAILANNPDLRLDDESSDRLMADVSAAVGYDAAKAVQARASEEQMQRDLFTWIRGQQGAVPELRWAFHVPNGGHRLAVVGAKMRRAGVRRGVPDCVLPIYRYSRADKQMCCGVVLELKIGRNTPTPEQRDWLDHFRRHNWKTAVVYNDWQLAANVLLRYLGRDELLFDVEVDDE